MYWKVSLGTQYGGPLFGGGPLLGGSVIRGSAVYSYLLLTKRTQQPLAISVGILDAFLHSHIHLIWLRRKFAENSKPSAPSAHTAHQANIIGHASLRSVYTVLAATRASLVWGKSYTSALPALLLRMLSWQQMASFTVSTWRALRDLP